MLKLANAAKHNKKNLFFFFNRLEICIVNLVDFFSLFLILSTLYLFLVSIIRFIRPFTTFSKGMESCSSNDLTPESKEYSDLDKAKKNLNKSMKGFKLPSNFNYENFRHTANGLFQAEGHISCRIKNLGFIPVFVLTQNYSLQSLNFFVTLWYILGSNTNLSITISQSGNLVIRLSSESWKIILSTLLTYFSLIYGEKFIAFKKLLQIRELSQSGIIANINLAVILVYSLASDGPSRKLTLVEQLSLFGINDLNLPVKIPNYTDNMKIPSILFMIGFIVGDGSFLIRLRLLNTGSI